MSDSRAKAENSNVVVSGDVPLARLAQALKEHGLVSDDYASRVTSGWTDQKMHELAATAAKGLKGATESDAPVPSIAKINTAHSR